MPLPKALLARLQKRGLVDSEKKGKNIKDMLLLSCKLTKINIF